MSITVACPACGKVLHAWNSLAGKSVVCSACSKDVHVPGTIQEPQPTAPPPTTAPTTTSPTSTVTELPLPAQSTPEYPIWVRHLHWLLALAMLPLAFQLVNRRDFQEDTVRRLEKTIDDAPPEVLIELHKKIQRGEASHKEILNVLLDSLPEHKLVGAFLPRHTYSHWLLAVGAAALFMSFFILLSRQSAQPSHLIAMGLFTATVGIGLLALLYLILHVAKLLGLSYQAALNPSIGFLVNLLAFTCLAGFCEELVKALPLLWCYRRAWARTWRGAFLWGMASGAGFGIAEAAGYATVYYNGILGPEIYAVRFLSCVALHAVWTGAVGITLHRRQARLQAAVTKSEYVWQVALIVAIPAVLHGLYDTMLTNDMIWGALGVAALSFVYLAWRIGRLNRGDRTTDTEAMIEEYWRRKTISPACETTR